MPITQVKSGDRYELMVEGRLDGALANQLEVEILNLIRENAQQIYVNLANSDFICSAGIRVLLQYYRQMKNSNKVLLVTRPSAAIQSTLDMTGFKNLIVEGSESKT
jgi:anti-anti-sigma factor